MITEAGAGAFLRDLQLTGLDARMQSDFVVFPYVIPLGPRVGESVRVGLQVPADFPVTPPPGPHFCPRIVHPAGAIHPSPLGVDWVYWSRPFPNWRLTDRSVSAYLAHIRALLAQL